MPETAAAKPGLRERKKLKTRAAIQGAAMRLFLAHGYDETTVEDIAEAAEVSPSTFFNYFATKEAVVLEDDLDPIIIAKFRDQPAGLPPVRAIRNAMREAFASMTPDQARFLQQRQDLIMRAPALRSAMLSDFAGLMAEISDLVAARSGRSPGDFEVRNLSGAMLGVIIGVLFSAERERNADALALLDRGLAHLEAGLPL